MCRCLYIELNINTDVPLHDANIQRIRVKLASLGLGLELTLAINDGQASMPSLSSRDQPKLDKESNKSSIALDTYKYSLQCNEDNLDLDYSYAMPSPTSLSFKVKRKLSNEAMMMKLESLSPISS